MYVWVREDFVRNTKRNSGYVLLGRHSLVRWDDQKWQDVFSASSLFFFLNHREYLLVWRLFEHRRLTR